jgi:hypothetical protein
MARASTSQQSSFAEDQVEEEGASFQEGSEDGSLLVDLSNVQEQSFEAIPRGTYNVVVDECRYEISKNSGKPMWNMRFTISEGEYENRKLFMYISFSEKALPTTKKHIARLSPELLEGAFNPKKVADDGTLIGKTCRVKVDIEKYEGQDRNRIRDILAPANDGFV